MTPTETLCENHKAQLTAAESLLGGQFGLAAMFRFTALCGVLFSIIAYTGLDLEAVAVVIWWGVAAIFVSVVAIGLWLPVLAAVGLVVLATKWVAGSLPWQKGT